MAQTRCKPERATQSESLLPAEKRLRDSIDILYDALVWTLGWCSDLRERVPCDEREGWCLYSGYMAVLGIPIEKILNLLVRYPDVEISGSQNLTFWRKSISRYAYCGEDDELHHRRPGEPVPKGFKVDHVEFRPRPCFLPFADIVAALKNSGKPMGRSLSDLLFSFEGVVVRNASNLANVVRTSRKGEMPASDALKEWYFLQQSGLNLETAPRKEETKKGNVKKKEKNPAAPSSMRGIMVPRPLLAKVLRKTCKTIARWDRDGFAPTGVKWIAGKRVAGNLVLYDLEQIWPAISSMLPRERDRKEDMRIAEELGAVNGGKRDRAG